MATDKDSILTTVSPRGSLPRLVGLLGTTCRRSDNVQWCMETRVCTITTITSIITTSTTVGMMRIIVHHETLGQCFDFTWGNGRLFLNVLGHDGNGGDAFHFTVVIVIVVVMGSIMVIDVVDTVVCG